ncbi:MAG: 2OG-Fe dioxygenase family protein [Bacteroidota bacterium]
MPNKKLPIDQTQVSDRVGRSIKSPILVAHLSDLELDASDFLQHFSSQFRQLAWDPYDMRRQQMEFLFEQFPQDVATLQIRFKAYYTGVKDRRSIRHWVGQLSAAEKASFESIRPWRRRAVAHFEMRENKRSLSIKRKEVPAFRQDVEEEDVRSWPRQFEEAPANFVEDERFYQLLGKIFRLVQNVRQGVSKLRVTAHLMSVQATVQRAGDNSPEGAHEDGADFIISALVVNRTNLRGGESQVIEKREDGQKEIILRRVLQEGEFIFQADSRDELVYGTDLWHHVTPFYVDDPSKGEGWRDIIGFDINVG